VSSKADSKGAATTGPHQIKVCGQHIDRGSQEFSLSGATGMAVVNAALLLLVPAPAITFDCFCRSYSLKVHAEHADPSSFAGLLSCSVWQDQPLTTVNLLLIWNMCCFFWVLSLVQSSTWVSLQC